MQRPSLLKAGDKIVILSPSRQINESQLNRAIEVLNGWGLEVSLANNVLSRDGYFAGTDEERLQDLQNAINDPKISAVFCSRGGYGLSRIIDDLDLTVLKTNPKWIIGFSDITALHLKINQIGIESIHGLMPVQFEYDGVDKSIESLKHMLFEEFFSYEWASSINNVEGIAEAEIIGGNLSLLVDSLGTKTEINTDNKILFIEEIDEYYYKIDRMLNQLYRAGKFQNLKGLIVGQFTDLKDTQIPFGHSLAEIILSKIENKSLPVAFNSPFGHEAYNLAIPCGRKVKLSVDKNGTSLSG